MYGVNDHPDPDVERAITALCKALYAARHNGGRQNIIIIREKIGGEPGQQRGYMFRAVNGIPDLDWSVTDSKLLSQFVS